MATSPDIASHGPIAVVTGGSRGLGRALTTELVSRGWRVVIDGRDAASLDATLTALGVPAVTAIPGDVADPAHRDRIAAAIGPNGLDALINNASVLGPTPLPHLANYPTDDLAAVFAVNTFAPLALVQLLLPHLRSRRGRVVNISSDAAVEAYDGWGGYGSSKAALDHITAVLAVEHPELPVYSFDPGDMRTEMQQAAFPGTDIGDRPMPETVVPDLLHLLTGSLPSGRYRVGEPSRLRTPA